MSVRASRCFDLGVRKGAVVAIIGRPLAIADGMNHTSLLPCREVSGSMGRLPWRRELWCDSGSRRITGNLDSENPAALPMLVKDLNRRLGQTMLMITGDFERDRLWRQDCAMRAGCIV